MVIDKYGDAPMRLAEVPTPNIGEYEILAEIRAASINPIDFKIRDGKVKLLIKYEMPLILGNDFSGVVVRVGTKVSRFKVGDEIYARPRKSKIGTFAEFIAIHEDDIALKPKNLSFEEAASIPLVGLTSYQALHDIMQLQTGQKVLIHAGFGGVGTFAIQLAKLMGATVATNASEAGANLVTTLGADEVINYKTEKFEELLKITMQFSTHSEGRHSKNPLRSLNVEEKSFQFQAYRMPALRKSMAQVFLKDYCFQQQVINWLHLKRSMMLTIHFYL